MSQIVPLAVVPLFFFISGYLYFVNIGNASFGLSAWKKKTHNRLKSQLIPYVAWNLLVLILFAVVQSLTGNSDTMQKDGYKQIASYELADYLKSMWAMDSTGMPIDGPLWFVRDLIVTSIVFSYPIWYLLKKAGVFGLFLIWCVWQLVGSGVPGVSLPCIFYFSWGALCGMKNFDLFTAVSRKTKHLLGLTILTSLLVFFIVDMVHWEPKSDLFNQVYIYVTVLFVFGWLSLYIADGKLKPIAFLGNASFFIYAMHKPVQVIVRRVAFAVFHPTSEVMLSAMVVLIPAVVIGVCLAAFYIVKNYIPQLKFLNGYRL